MAHKYALAVYTEIKNHSGSFGVITEGNKYAYPTEIGSVEDDKSGVEKVIYSKYIVFVIVEHSSFGATQDTAIATMITAWNLANPTNEVPIGLQTVYDYADRKLIMTNLESQITNLRSAWP